MKKIGLLLFFISIFSFVFAQKTQIQTGAEQVAAYIPVLQGQKVALVANQTSVVGSTHLLDTLLTLGIEIKKIFCPEHGFRGNAEAGASIKDGKDEKTGLPLLSLYGKNKKPHAKDLADIDIIVFDIQDVGTRFYTYISTLHLIMEAAAESKKKVLILDRPNPNGFYIDGPILDTSLRSFVGMHPVPIVHGMTIAEYALMINGEKWLANGLQCSLQVIKMQHYTHDSLYTLPIAPSPNLQSMNAIYLYPSLCWFEGTSVSVGRGTSSPFEVIGSPKYPNQSFSFTPKSKAGISENPPFKDETCYGLNLAEKSDEIIRAKHIELSYLLEMYTSMPHSGFFQPFFDKLAGTRELRKQIENGFTEKKIRKSWAKGLKNFKQKRKQYLLYEDFE